MLEAENLSLSQSLKERCVIFLLASVSILSNSDLETPNASMELVLREENDQELRERHECLSQEFNAKQEELQRLKVSFDDAQYKVAAHMETYRRQNAVMRSAHRLGFFCLFRCIRSSQN